MARVRNLQRPRRTGNWPVWAAVGFLAFCILVTAVAGRRRGRDEAEVGGKAAIAAATSLSASGRLAEAEARLYPAWSRARSKLGARHATTLTAQLLLADLWRRSGEARKQTDALKALRAAWEGAKAELGEEHALALQAAGALGDALREGGQLEEAEPLLTHALSGSQRALGGEHPLTLTATSRLARLYRAQGRYAAALTLLHEELAARERLGGAQDVEAAAASAAARAAVAAVEALLAQGGVHGG